MSNVMEILNMPKVEDDRAYMIMGEDEHGDMHLVGTNCFDRALSHYMRMATELRWVEGNSAFWESGGPMTEKPN